MLYLFWIELPIFGRSHNQAMFNKDPEHFFCKLPDSGEGVVSGLLCFLAEVSSDSSLRDHIASIHSELSMNHARRPITFLSERFLRKTLIMIKNDIIRRIVHEINTECAQQYAIQIDSSTDVAVRSQHIIVLRYVTKAMTIKNRVVSVRSGGNVGAEVYNHLKHILENMGLSLKYAIAT